MLDRMPCLWVQFPFGKTCQKISRARPCAHIPTHNNGKYSLQNCIKYIKSMEQEGQATEALEKVENLKFLNKKDCFKFPEFYLTKILL